MGAHDESIRSHRKWGSIHWLISGIISVVRLYHGVNISGIWGSNGNGLHIIGASPRPTFNPLPVVNSSSHSKESVWVDSRRRLDHDTIYLANSIMLIFIESISRPVSFATHMTAASGTAIARMVSLKAIVGMILVGESQLRRIATPHPPPLPRSNSSHLRRLG